MWSPLKGNFILLSDEDAARFNGFENDSHRFGARNIGDGNHIIGETILENSAYAPIIPDLMKLPRCRLQQRIEDDDTQVLRIKPRSIFTPDNSLRVYSPTGHAFERPPFPAKGDWSADTLYASIGRALSSWEHAEIALADLFNSLLSPNLYGLPAQRAFGSVITSRGRMEMLQAAATAFFMAFPNKEDSSKFEDLLKRAGKYAARRNEIAHGIVGNYAAPDGPDRGLALLPPRYATSKRSLVPHQLPHKYPPRDKPTYAYTSPEVLFFSDRFYELSREIHALANHLYRLFPHAPLER